MSMLCYTILLFDCMDNLVICIFFSRDHKSSSKSHHKSSHSHGSSSKDHHKDRHGDKRKHGSSSSSSKHHHKSAKKSRRWILESYQARIHFCCLKKDCQSFPNYAPQIIHTYVSFLSKITDWIETFSTCLQKCCFILEIIDTLIMIVISFGS